MKTIIADDGKGRQISITITENMTNSQAAQKAAEVLEITDVFSWDSKLSPCFPDGPVHNGQTFTIRPIRVLRQ